MDREGKRRARRTLSPRLEKALELLGDTDVLADIGCDHGYFSIAALKRGRCKSVIAADVSAPSLRKAERHAAECGLQERFAFRCGDGLSVLASGEANAAVLLGMGGELIVSILEASAECACSLERIVMQPMRGEAELRKYLYKNGWHILDEAVVLDGGRFYQLISARYEQEAVGSLPDGWPDGYYQFGAAALFKHEAQMLPMMRRYLAIMERKLERAEKNGSVPKALLWEADCTRELIRLFETTIQTEE